MQLFSNNADASLNGAIASDTTAIVLKEGEGSKFPSPAAGDYFLVTIFDRLGTTELNHEIVKCTSRVGDALTVTRAQEGTSAKNFPNGACVELRVTAGTLNNKVEKVEGKSLSTEDFTTDEKTKLGGIASGATANSSDAFLKNRANHTGTQTIQTIEGLDSALETKLSAPVADGKAYAYKDDAWVEVPTESSTNTLTNKTIHGNVNTLTVDGVNEVGFRHIPQNSKSAAYTLVLADAGKHILHPAVDTTARIFTIPANSAVAFPIGTAITFINQNGTGGVVTIAITTDTMRLAGAGTTGSRTLARNGIATAIKITATEWIISGTGLT